MMVHGTRFLLLAALLAFGFIGTSWTEEDPLPPSLRALLNVKPDIQDMTLEVDIGQTGEENANPRWPLSATDQSVFIGQLERLDPRKPHPDDMIFMQIPPLDEQYQGLVLRVKVFGESALRSFRFGRGRVMTEEGQTLVKDPGRLLEYWLFGTAPHTRLRLLATQVLPVFRFEQCSQLGNLLIETTPRQCLMPNNNILLQIAEEITPKSLKAVDFDTCLEHGKALIDVFPRRCLAAGGRVYTEPPRLVEQAVPSAQNISMTEETALPALPEGMDMEAFLAPYQQEMQDAKPDAMHQDF